MWASKEKHAQIRVLIAERQNKSMRIIIIILWQVTSQKAGTCGADQLIAFRTGTLHNKELKISHV